MLNKIILTGRISTDITLQKTTGGQSYLSFNLANDRPKPKDQEKPTTDFIRIKAWNKNAEFISQYCSKGDLIYVEGRLQVSNWKDKNGNNQTSSEVSLEVWERLRSTKKQESTSGDSRSTSTAPSIPNDVYDEPMLDISSDDLPF